ncbi:MAG: hypothetical protein IOC66_13460 [Burkholderia sp.]|jgi:hypothetical protein|nr:hypothetical protein [Burkholderia sp.]
MASSLYFLVFAADHTPLGLVSQPANPGAATGWGAIRQRFARTIAHIRLAP